MDLAMIGLGRMRANMTERLLRGGYGVLGHDRDAAAVRRVVEAGGAGADSVEAFVHALTPPRAIWLMVPAGPPVDGHAVRCANA